MTSSKTIRRIHDVFGLSALQKEELAQVTRVFPFRAPEYYLSLIDWEDPDDPIRRIVIPDARELEESGCFDPCDEAANFVAPGVQHKYTHTALIVCTDRCAGLCRYCFRKRLFWEEHEQVRQDFTPQTEEVAWDPEPALEYVRRTPRITNVLLTGGDPLTLPTARLAYILEQLREIPHVGIIRIGSRMPVYNPHRILDDPTLIRAVRRVSTNQHRVYLMTHFDHPRELTDLSVAAVAEFINNGVPVCNQHPILAGINDDPDTLATLYRELSAAGVVPYYMFVVRPTRGNQMFQVPIVRAYEVLSRAKHSLCGLDKRVRLAMSHSTGKIAVLAVDDDFIYLKYHRARDARDEGRLMICHRDDDALWLEDLTPVELTAGPTID